MPVAAGAPLEFLGGNEQFEGTTFGLEVTELKFSVARVLAGHDHSS